MAARRSAENVEFSTAVMSSALLLSHLLHIFSHRSTLEFRLFAHPCDCIILPYGMPAYSHLSFVFCMIYSDFSSLPSLSSHFSLFSLFSLPSDCFCSFITHLTHKSNMCKCFHLICMCTHTSNALAASLSICPVFPWRKG